MEDRSTVIAKENLPYRLAFSAIGNALEERRVGFDPGFYGEIDFAENVFYDLVFALKKLRDSGKNRYEYGGYFEEVIAATGNDFPRNTIEILKTALKIRKMNRELETLKRNPAKFYDDFEKTEKWRMICRRMEEVYS